MAFIYLALFTKSVDAVMRDIIKRQKDPFLKDKTVAAS